MNKRKEPITAPTIVIGKMRKICLAEYFNSGIDANKALPELVMVPKVLVTLAIIGLRPNINKAGYEIKEVNPAAELTKPAKKPTTARAAQNKSVPIPNSLDLKVKKRGCTPQLLWLTCIIC